MQHFFVKVFPDASLATIAKDPGTDGEVNVQIYINNTCSETKNCQRTIFLGFVHTCSPSTQDWGDGLTEEETDAWQINPFLPPYLSTSPCLAAFQAKLAGRAGGALFASFAETGLPATFTAGCRCLSSADTGRAGLFSFDSWSSTFPWYFCITCGAFFYEK